MLIPQTQGERLLTIIMAKLKQTVSMYMGCLSLKVGVKKSALDMGQVRVFMILEQEVSKGGIWQANKWGYRSRI